MARKNNLRKKLEGKAGPSRSELQNKVIEVLSNPGRSHINRQNKAYQLIKSGNPTTYDGEAVNDLIQTYSEHIRGTNYSISNEKRVLSRAGGLGRAIGRVTGSQDYSEKVPQTIDSDPVSLVNFQLPRDLGIVYGSDSPKNLIGVFGEIGGPFNLDFKPPTSPALALSSPNGHTDGQDESLIVTTSYVTSGSSEESSSSSNSTDSTQRLDNEAPQRTSLLSKFSNKFFNSKSTPWERGLARIMTGVTAATLIGLSSYFLNDSQNKISTSKPQYAAVEISSQNTKLSSPIESDVKVIGDSSMFGSTDLSFSSISNVFPSSLLNYRNLDLPEVGLQEAAPVSSLEKIFASSLLDHRNKVSIEKLSEKDVDYNPNLEEIPSLPKEVNEVSKGAEHIEIAIAPISDKNLESIISTKEVSNSQGDTYSSEDYSYMIGAHPIMQPSTSLSLATIAGNSGNRVISDLVSYQMHGDKLIDTPSELTEILTTLGKASPIPTEFVSPSSTEDLVYASGVPVSFASTIEGDEGVEGGSVTWADKGVDLLRRVNSPTNAIPGVLHLNLGDKQIAVASTDDLREYLGLVSGGRR